MVQWSSLPSLREKARWGILSLGFFFFFFNFILFFIFNTSISFCDSITFLFFLVFCLFLMHSLVILTWFCFSNVFADKRHVAPKLNLINVMGLNKVLRSEVFVSKDRQLRVVHLIFDFKPLSENFQDVGNVIRAGDPWITWIDLSVPGFLAQEDLPPVELPLHRSPVR